MSPEEIHRHNLPPESIVSRYATLDIETTGVDSTSNQSVAIGIGTYDALLQELSVDVLTYGGAMGGERALIRRAYERINEFEPDALVTFNGKWFDLDFLAGRIEQLNFEREPRLQCEDHHIDLFLPRKRRAEEAGRKWPALEEVLKTHGMPVPTTEWQEAELTNTRFGESLAPEYLEAIHENRTSRVKELEAAIYEYTVTDVEANIALYEADAGRHNPM